MASQDNYFVVRKGIGVGTAALYVDGSAKSVAIGKTVANYSLDVLGKVYSSNAIYSQNAIGVGTTSNNQQLDVIGTVYVSNSIGIGTTNPTQAVQVGIANTQSVVITGVGSIGVGTITPTYSVDIFGNQRVVGLSTLSQAIIGISTVGFASITEEVVGISTVGFASITQEIVGISTVGFGSITQEIVGISTVGFASITSEAVGISTIDSAYIGIASITQEIVGISTVGIASITQEIVGISTVGFASITQEIVGISTVGFSSISQEIVGISTVGFASITQEIVGISTVGFASITNELVGVSTVGFASITQEIVGISTVGFASISQEIVGISTVGFASISQEIVGISTIQNLYVSGIATAINLDVGIGATILKASGFSTTSSTVPVRGGTRQKVNTPLVGVGTNTPTSALDIAGDIRIRGEVFDSNNNVGYAYSVLASNGEGSLVWQPPGARIGNEWFVNKLGDDNNQGRSPGDAFLTIKKACSVAQPGDTIRVFAGLYTEDGPIQVPERVAIVGEDLRRTLVTTSGSTDLYHVRRGCYISHQSFVGPTNESAMVSFPTQGNGYADGTEENWISPYVQNCTNFVPNSIGMRIDGNRAGGFKSMVLDAYTQYNQGGIGVSITNFGYAQLVSLFTICCDTAVFCDTGGVCDLNNSNSSFGNYGLWAQGTTPLQYTGEVVSVPNTENIDSLTINVGVGASTEFKDTVNLLRRNKEFIATEAVGFLTSTDGPYGSYGPSFDYGGSTVGRQKCIRDGQIIVESICSDILTLGNSSSIAAGSAYRDSPSGSLTYLIETSPPPTGFSAGYVKDGEIALINHISGICTYVAQNISLPVSYQNEVSQIKDFTKNYSANVEPIIGDRAGIITSIVDSSSYVPSLVLPKGQRPYDGQVAYIDTQYYFVSAIEILDPGSGYTPGVPLEVSIDLPQNVDYFIPAEAAIFENDINDDGTISGVTLIASGTGYSSTPPTITIAPPPPGGTVAIATAIMERLFFNPVSATQVSPEGNTAVTFDQFITYPISVGSTVYFYQSSKIIASSITFEYVGSGINILDAIPSKGGVTQTDNQIVSKDGGKVPFTSTDQGGNFRISEGITINQNTGTITGQSFSKSLQAEVTPLIIALQQ